MTVPTIRSDVPTLRLDLAPQSQDSARRARAIPPTFWLEGGLVGILLLGPPGYRFARAVCADSDSGGAHDTCFLRSLLAGFMTGALGFSMGSLIGGLFPKPPRPDCAAAGLTRQCG